MELNNVILKWVSPTTKVSDKFTKREIVVETVEEYPQLLKIEVHNAKCKDYESIPLNTMVDLRIDLRGRKWTNPQGVTTVINSILAWKVQPKIVHTPVPVTQITQNVIEDLPF
jgi:hypothetical protein